MGLPKFTAEASLSTERRVYAASQTRYMNALAISPSAIVPWGVSFSPNGTYPCLIFGFPGCCRFYTVGF